MSETLDFGNFDESVLKESAAPETPPAAETPEGTPPAGTPPVQDDLYEVKVGGRVFRVPKDELVNGYQRQQDYTRKTMELAEQRKAWDSERSQLQAQIEEVRAWLQRPENVKTYLEQLVAKTGYETPAELTTAQQVQQMLANQQAQVQKLTEERIAAATREIELRQLSDRYLAEIDTTVKGIVESLPELKAIPGIDRLIRNEVADRNPANLQEAKVLLREVAEERAKAIKSFFSQQQKQQEVQKAQVQKGIEPPGGRGVVTPPGKQPRLGTPDFVNSVIAEMTALQRESQ